MLQYVRLLQRFSDCLLSDNPVTTSVNQCLQAGKVTEGPTWIQHGNVAYLFPDRAHVNFTAGPQEGRWSDIGTGSSELVRKNVFNLWIDHGIRPKDATYEYRVYPGGTAAASGEEVQIIANKPEQQAVYHKRLNLLAVAFWQPGRAKNVEVDRRCLLLLRGGKLAISNPENQPGSVKVSVDGNPLDVKLPEGDLAGSSVITDVARAAGP